MSYLKTTKASRLSRKHRMFGRRKYSYECSTTTKREATKEAARLRSIGIRARVIKATEGYDIWISD